MWRPSESMGSDGMHKLEIMVPPGTAWGLRERPFTPPKGQHPKGWRAVNMGAYP